MERLHCCTCYCPVGECFNGESTLTCQIFLCRANKSLLKKEFELKWMGIKSLSSLLVAWHLFDFFAKLHSQLMPTIVFSEYFLVGRFSGSCSVNNC